MAWETIFRVDRFSAQIAPQTVDLLTHAGSGFVVVDCDLPQVSYEAIQSDTKRSRQRTGTKQAPFPGRVLPKLAIKWPVPGQRATYAPASAGPILAGLNMLFGVLDSSAGANCTNTYQTVCFEATGSDANTWLNKTSTPLMGSFLVFGGTNLVTDGATGGFVTALEGGGPYTATLFEDCGVVPADDDKRLPSITLFPDGEFECKGWSVEIIGEAVSGGDAQKWKYTGFVPESLAFTVEDDVLWCTATGPCYGGEEITDDADGLAALDDILALDSVINTSDIDLGTRYVLGSQTANWDSTSPYDGTPSSSLDDGTADPDGNCDLRNVAWTYTIQHHALSQPSAICGVGAVTVASAEPTITVAAPAVDEYHVDTDEHLFLDLWKKRHTVSFSCYYGGRPGRMLAFNWPALRAMKRPEKIEIDGIWYWQIELDPTAPYTVADGTDSNAGNKAWRIGVA